MPYSVPCYLKIEFTRQFGKPNSSSLSLWQQSNIGTTGPAILKTVYSRRIPWNPTELQLFHSCRFYVALESFFSQFRQVTLQVGYFVSLQWQFSWLYTNESVISSWLKIKQNKNSCVPPFREFGHVLLIHFPSEQSHFSFGCLARI